MTTACSKPDGAADARCKGAANFLDWLARSRQQRRTAARPQEREKLSELETESWLKEFADLENTPEFKKLFEPYDFER